MNQSSNVRASHNTRKPTHAALKSMLIQARPFCTKVIIHKPKGRDMQNLPVHTEMSARTSTRETCTRTLPEQGSEERAHARPVVDRGRGAEKDGKVLESHWHAAAHENAVSVRPLFRPERNSPEGTIHVRLTKGTTAANNARPAGRTQVMPSKSTAAHLWRLRYRQRRPPAYQPSRAPCARNSASPR